MRPVMTQLKDKMEFLREKMLKRTMVKLPDLDERERRAVENLSKMLLRKFLRDPMMAMQEAAGTEQETFYRRAIKEMFNLTQVGEEDDDHEAAPDHWDETK
jgi:glutamyl-tRNA reductase